MWGQSHCNITLAPWTVHSLHKESMSQDTVLVWMLSLNREYTKEVRLLCWCPFTILLTLLQEYDIIYRLQQVAFPNDKQEYKQNNADSFREDFFFLVGFSSCHSIVFRTPIVAGNLMTQLLPLLMMRHRRVPRAKWVDHITPNGKHWIEHVRMLFFLPSLRCLTYGRRRIPLIDPVHQV